MQRRRIYIRWFEEDSAVKETKKICDEIDFIIYFLLLFYMLVDCITGLFGMYGIPGISQPYKMLLMFLMVLSLKSYIGAVIYFYFFGIVSVSLVMYFFNSYTNFSNSLAMQLRIIMAPILFIFLKTLYKKDPRKVFNIIKANTIVLIGNLILGLLGFGDSTYKQGEATSGIKGFFYDGNALAAILFVTYVLWINLRPSSKYKISIVFLFFGLLVGTKVSVLSIVLYFCAYSFFSVHYRKRFFTIFVLSLSISLLIYILFQTSFFQYQIERIKWLLTLFKGNYLSVILSGRNLDLIKHYKFYQTNFSIRELLFGFGFLNFTKIIELDFFDTFFSYGLLFFCGIFSFYLYCFLINRKNSKIMCFNLLFFCLCVTSGHIWFNSQAALFFSIVNIIFSERGEKLNETYFNAYKHVSFSFESDIRHLCKTDV